MKNYYYRMCKHCDNVLKFEEKDKMTVKPCYCKTCRKYFDITEVNDLPYYDF